jgi:hypothetical protein
VVVVVVKGGVRRRLRMGKGVEGEGVGWVCVGV